MNYCVGMAPEFMLDCHVQAVKFIKESYAVETALATTWAARSVLDWPWSGSWTSQTQFKPESEPGVLDLGSGKGFGYWWNLNHKSEPQTWYGKNII